MTLQIVSLAGAVLVLAAFLASSFAGMDRESFAYGLLNAVGTFLLALTVIEPLNVGLLVVEITWCLASIVLCFRAWQRR